MKIIKLTQSIIITIILASQIFINYNHNKRNNICLMFSTIIAGGVDRVNQILSQQLSDSGYQINMITAKILQNELPLDIRVKRNIISYANVQVKQFQITQIYKYHNLNIIVCQDIWEPDFAQLTLFLKENTSMKIVVIHHSTFFLDLYNQLYRSMGQMYKNIDVLCCLSRADVKYFQWSGIQNSYYIPNVLTFNLQQLKQANLLSKNIIMVGRLHYLEKRQYLAIEAFYKVLKVVPDAIFQIIGPSSIQDKWELAQYYMNASIFIMTSGYEGFPMALMEAKAYGIPNIIMKMDYQEAAKEGTISVGKENTSEMADEIVKLLSNDSYRIEQGRLARESVKQFSNEKTMKKWVQLFNILLNNDQEALNKLINNQLIISNEEARKIALEEFECAQKIRHRDISFEDIFK